MSHMMTRTEQMKQRRGRERKFLKFTLLALVLLVASTAASYYWFSQSSLPTPKRQKHKMASQSAPVQENGGKVNILVLGVDHRKDDVGRSDTLFVVTFDTKTKQTSLLSIPRDTRVKIPGYGFDKINHAYALGGYQLTQKTVEELLGCPIDYYVEIDFAGFSKIVDAVGGVDITVDKRMYYEDPYDDLVIDFRPGQQQLDGDAAIKYVRYRDEEGDIGRIQRQQQFVKAMMDKVASPAIIVQLPTIISEINNAIRTDLSIAEMVGMGKVLKDAKDQGLKTDVVPATPIDIGQISYLHPDIVALREQMAKVLGFIPDMQYLAAAKRLATEYQYSLPDETMPTGAEPPKDKSNKSKESADKQKAAKTGLTEPPVKAASPKTQTPVKKSAAQAPANKKTTQQPAKAPAAQTPAKAAATKEAGALKADIVNASGNAAMAERMAAQLRRQGFAVTQITNAKTTSLNTIVIAHTADEQILSKVTSLPFNYALQVTPQANRPTQVTVVVGKDYTGR